MTIADELLVELTHNGNRPSYSQLVAAILSLEVRQAEAMCLVLWALPPAMVMAIVRGDMLEQLARREGYSIRATARVMGCTHQAVRELLERAKPNVAAGLVAGAS